MAPAPRGALDPGSSEDRLPPGPGGLPLLANAPAFRRDQLGFLARLQRRHGPAATIAMPRGFRLFFLAAPQGIAHVLAENARNFTSRELNYPSMPFLGDGLLNIDGERHRQERALVQPAFGRRRVEAYAEVMAAYTEDMLRTWRPGQVVDMRREMQRLTLRIVGKALLHAELDGPSLDAFGRAFDAVVTHRERRSLLPPLRLEVPWLPYGRMVMGERHLNAFVHGLIARRRADGTDEGDVMSMLLRAQTMGAADEGDPATSGHPAIGADPTTGTPRPVQSRAAGSPPHPSSGPDLSQRARNAGGAMTDAQVRDHLMTLLAAGHETTSHALTYALLLLARHPRERDRLQAELSRELGGRTPGPEDVERLRHLDRVVKESMRLYPPAWVIGRRSIGSYETLGYRFPAGSFCLMSQWVTHRMPDLWPDADQFQPDRWLPPEQGGQTVAPFAYFPFGGGPRMCIGMPFAALEVRMLLAMIVARFSPESLPGERLILEPVVTLRPRSGTRMRLRPAP